MKRKRRAAKRKAALTMKKSSIGETNLLISQNVKESKRERNREAVRNCRKRKREKALELQERIAILKKENILLREAVSTAKSSQPLLTTSISKQSELLMKLLGSTKNDTLQILLPEIERELKSLKQASNIKHKRSKKDPEERIDDLTIHYVKEHFNHGQNKRTAISYIAQSMENIIKARPITLLFCYLSDKAEIWELLAKELDLSSQQLSELQLRELYFEKIKLYSEVLNIKTKQIRYALSEGKKTADTMHNLTKVLSSRQLAQFIVWVQRDPGFTDILDSLFSSLRTKYDNILSKQEKPCIELEYLKKFQNLNARFVQMMFKMPMLQRIKTACYIFHPQIRLRDVNNSYDITGLTNCAEYIESIGKAFSSYFKQYSTVISLKHDSDIDNEINKIELTWKQKGHYIGKLLNNHSDCKVKDNDEGVFIEMKILGQFIFSDVKQPELITELDINWDVLGLIKQLKQRAYHDHSKCLRKHKKLFKNKTLSLEREQEQEQEQEISKFTSKQTNHMNTQRELVYKLMILYEAKEIDIEEKSYEIFSNTSNLTEIFSGIVYKGLKQITSYFKRIPNILPKFRVIEREIIQMIPLYKVEEYRHFISKSTSKDLYRIVARIRVEAMYNGSILKQVKNKLIDFGMEFEIESCLIEKKIKKINVYVTTQDIMHQIGID